MATEIDIYALANQRISLAENVTYKCAKIRNSIEMKIKHNKHIKYWNNRSEEVKERKRERDKIYRETKRQTKEYKQKHAEYMRVWRKQNEYYRERNKERMRKRRAMLKAMKESA